MHKNNIYASMQLQDEKELFSRCSTFNSFTDIPFSSFTYRKNSAPFNHI